MIPLTRKENSRIYNEFKKLRETHKDNHRNRLQLDKGKLYLNDNVVDEFNLINQIFQMCFQIYSSSSWWLSMHFIEQT